jgi:hypothetical protein
MKRIVTGLILFLILTTSLLINGSSSSSNITGIHDAIEKSGRHIVNFMYQVEVKNGYVVFFYKGINGGKDSTLAAGFVKKTFRGWEWVNGGEHQELGQPLTAQYFPATEGTPFPLAFGEIRNPQIVQIQLQTEKGQLEKPITYIKAESKTVWFVFLSPTDGTKVTATGLDQSGQSVASTLSL